MFKSYINPEEGREANRKLPKLMVEGLLLGGSGLGVLALIFEIAADAFSVAAYQTLLAIHGAEGHHSIAFLAFFALSVLLFLGIVPAYKAGAYLRPNAGGSGPLVEAIGPKKMSWLSWVGSSLFFIDAVLTIIISSISAADATMLIYPQMTEYRILLAEVYAFLIMGVLVALGPKRAVPLFLIGGGAFTIFTLFALSIVGANAAANPQWAFLTTGIVNRLEMTGVVEHVVRAQQDAPAIGSVLFFQLFFRSMSSAMLGFSGYEVIPASGKHAARPKWKVINTALTLAAVFLIGTGLIQLYAAQQWKIPSTEGYSTLLIEYEIVAAQTFGLGVDEDAITVTDADRLAAANAYEEFQVEEVREELAREQPHMAAELAGVSRDEAITILAPEMALIRTVNNATSDTTGETFLFVAGVLLAIILLLAQGGGYVGGAAVAANGARLGRLPGFFSDDRIGIAVIWGISAVLIPIIREVVIVEAYYAFGFVSAFVITSTTVFFVRDDALIERGIQPDSGEAKSLRFAGLRGMIASYIMAVVLVTQKTSALPAIVIAATVIILFQLYITYGNVKASTKKPAMPAFPPGTNDPDYDIGLQRAHDQARQRGIADCLLELIESNATAKFNVSPEQIKRLVGYLHNVDPDLLFPAKNAHHEHTEEPSLELEATYQNAYNQRNALLREIENHSHFGIFMFINNYHVNWVDKAHGRDETVVQQAMLDVLFPMTPHEEIWNEYQNFKPIRLPEPIWQFSRERYRWAKDQWPNLSGRITTIWTLQELGLLSKDIDVKTMVMVAGGKSLKMVKVHFDAPSNPPVGQPDEAGPEMPSLENPPEPPQA